MGMEIRMGRRGGVYAGIGSAASESAILVSRLLGADTYRRAESDSVIVPDRSCD